MPGLEGQNPFGLEKKDPPGLVGEDPSCLGRESSLGLTVNYCPAVIGVKSAGRQSSLSVR